MIGRRWLVSGVAMSLVWMGGATPVGAQSATHMSRVNRTSLVSKDVGNERWAITYDIDTGAVTGNVFFPQGGEPQFVVCSRVSRQDGKVKLRCSGSGPCESQPCGGWKLLQEVELPESFFLPPGPPEGDCTGVEDDTEDVEPGYVDVSEISADIAGSRLNATFTLREMPSELPFNRPGFTAGRVEYAWQVWIDVDDDPDTGYHARSASELPREGADYLLVAQHVFDGAPVTLPVQAGLVARLFKVVNGSDGYVGIDASASVTVDVEANTVDLSAQVPNLSDNARLVFWAQAADDPDSPNVRDGAVCEF